jgi:hypothetical protein
MIQTPIDQPISVAAPVRLKGLIGADPVVDRPSERYQAGSNVGHQVPERLL